MMNILAIDPGTTESAFVIYHPIERGVLHFGKIRNDEMEFMLEDEAWGVESDYGECALVYEMFASYGMPVGKEVFETCLQIGRFLRAYDGDPSLMPSGKIFRLYRKEVMVHHCGSARGKDANIRRALLDRLGPQGTKKAPGPLYGITKDCWSALAIAVCFADRNPALWQEKTEGEAA